MQGRILLCQNQSEKKKKFNNKKKGWTCGGDHTKTHNIGFIEKIKKKNILS